MAHRRPQLHVRTDPDDPSVGELIAEVTDKGRLNLRASVAEPDRALALARWILDVFEEP